MGFFEVHGIICGLIILFGLTFFPRSTMLGMAIFGNLIGGCFWWIGWLLVPHVVVAYEAINTYWKTNPILCIIAIIVAFLGTSFEVSVVKKQNT